MKKLLIFTSFFIMLLFSPYLLNGQSNYYDYFFYKNENINISTKAEQQFLASTSKVQKNKLRDANSFLETLNVIDKNNSESKENYRFKNTGYIDITELNYNIGFSDSKEFSSYGIQIVNGYLINPYISIGIGFGIDRLNIDHNVFETTLPIFLDFRFYFVNNPKILFFTCDAGYVFNHTGYKLGYRSALWGKYINPSFGYRFFIFSKTAINLSIGLKFQENTIKYLNMVLPRTEKYINIKAGFSF